MLTSTSFLFAVAVVFLTLNVTSWRKKRSTMRQQLLRFVFFVYVLAVLSITLFPIPYQHPGGGNLQSNNLIPFRTIGGILSANSFANDIRNIGGNLLLLVPFGFLYPLVFRRSNRVVKMILIGFAVSLLIETSQWIISAILGFTYRSFDVDDLLLNTLGSCIGYLVFPFSQRLVQDPQGLRGLRRTWMVAGPFLIVLGLLAYWGYRYETHSTPQKAMESYDANVLSLESIPFTNGVVLMTPTDPAIDQEPGYVAWYMEKTQFSGWHLKTKSVSPLQESHLAQGMTFQSLSMEEQTFVWGTTGKSGVKKVTYRTNGASYSGLVDEHGFWHVILPFALDPSFAHADWTITVQDGRTAPLFS
jgi:glycopeptide antibiotics resistance protein